MVAKWLTIVDPLVAPWGLKILFNHPQKEGTQPTFIKNRAAHLIGKNANIKVENRTQDTRKIAWFGAVRKTIRDPQVRAVAKTGEVLYFHNYIDGIHMVIMDGGTVKDHAAIITQFAPEAFEKRFKNVRVEFVREATEKPSR